tara:strand:- start:1009 stop:1374 length:366 start_codon:yes stop_codon:yes gene_type:complete
MTKEQKEGLVNMEWKDIIKESRKDKDPETTGDMFDERRIKTSGGAGFDEDKFGRIKDSKETHLDESADLEINELANATRQDLIDKVMYMIGSMSDDELIDLLITSQGEVEVRDIGVTNRRG